MERSNDHFAIEKEMSLYDFLRLQWAGSETPVRPIHAGHQLEARCEVVRLDVLTLRVP